MKGDGISRIERRYAGLVDLMRRKNAGYAGASQDEWVNFRAIEPLATAEVGLMARLGDKWNRLRSLMKNPANDQVGEDVQETIDDMINYLAIMGDIIYERQLYIAKMSPQERPCSFRLNFETDECGLLEDAEVHSHDGKGIGRHSYRYILPLSNAGVHHANAGNVGAAHGGTKPHDWWKCRGYGIDFEPCNAAPDASVHAQGWPQYDHDFV